MAAAMFFNLESSWECVQGVRHGFEGRNGENRRHLIGDKSFFRLAKRIKRLRHVGAANWILG